MPSSITVICLSILTSILVYSAPINRRKLMCKEISQEVLGEILGAAFNSRYMSVSEPTTVEDEVEEKGSLKRTPQESPFYVDDLYSHKISDTPAWKTNHLKLKPEKVKLVAKRATVQPRQWECTSKIRWLDLGPDYFPRYLRSIECTSTKCWYDMMRCKPRSFTVKLLRRNNRCVRDDGGIFGTVGLPQELRELWVWEERAVNFCCDCGL